jgi:hypothetical protein
MRHPLHIDQEQNNIIRAEVGERLRIILRLAPNEGTAAYSALVKWSGQTGP